ncbi:hypothetical protein HB364_32770 [Pseudoflavitalea sp. X16]|uniref:hypothetical protein n=1 Tax=Paraflavitalea devenefica TaxID=2716334 RepID=UPI00141E3384|nr:hypothetical protein [Paraflavitalea devenefica]NII29898.1 hypothetical protein [Paraflavitalea devenefica]
MATITGTRDAFIALLQERGVYTRLGVDRSTVSNWRRALKGQDNKFMPSLDKMEEMLLKSGAKVAREKVWIIPVEK